MYKLKITIAVVLLCGAAMLWIPRGGHREDILPPGLTLAQINNPSGGLPTGLTFASPTFTISSAGNGNAVLALSGNTSGNATLTAPATAGTTANPIVSSNAISFPDGTSTNPSFAFSSATNWGIYRTAAEGVIIVVAGTPDFATRGSAAGLTFANVGIIGWGSGVVIGGGGTPDTGLSRLGPAVTAIGNGSAAGDFAGFYKSSQIKQVITSNYTTSATTLATAGVITGLGFTTPVSLASKWSFSCNIVYSQATAAAANLWGVTTGGTAPTSLLAFGQVYTTQAGASVLNNAVITTATSTTVVTSTPGVFGAIGTTADMLQAHLWGTVEAPSNASPTTVGIAVASGSASDALTIYRGSFCEWN